MFVPGLPQEKDRQRKTRKRDRQMKQLGVPFRVHCGSYKSYFAVYLCGCGKPFIARTTHVKAGTTTQCRECFVPSGTRHGECGTPTWYSWQAMVTRCTNPNASDYQRYGGRGVTICREWHQYESFRQDMGARPEGHTLDRIDNNGNYTPSNCKWSTSSQQARNTRRTAMIEHKGVSNCIAEWAEDLAMPVATLAARLSKGWSIEEALETPVDATKRNKFALSE